MKAFRSGLPLLLCCLSTLSIPVQAQPNIVVIMVDDVGFNDVGYNNTQALTPNLDALAQDGVRLDHFYIQARCSPARQALMTGRYPIRWGQMRRVIRSSDAIGQPRSEYTLGEMLQDQGYFTAFLGKWHIGAAYNMYHPLNQGFDYFRGSLGGAVDYYTFFRDGARDYHENFAPGPPDEGTYFTDVLGARTVGLLDSLAGTSRPFFTFISFTAGHTPQQAPAEWIQYYEGLGFDFDRAAHLAQITVMDEWLGQIRETLEPVEDETVVLVVSDNGAVEQWGGENLPLRGEKKTAYEGGIRVPAVVYYPDGGWTNRVTDGMVREVDVFPTLMTQAGGTPVNPLDGVDVEAVLAGTGPGPDRDHFVYISEFDGAEQIGLLQYRSGQVGEKLVYTTNSGGDVAELFDLSTDPLEQTDLSSDRPTVVATLLDSAAAWKNRRPASSIPYVMGSQSATGLDVLSNWARHDVPLTCSSSPQEWYGADGDSLRVSDATFGQMSLLGHLQNAPHGLPNLSVGALGFSSRDQLLYVVTATAPHWVYQVDQQGAALLMGEVRGLSSGAEIAGGDVALDGSSMLVFDRVNRAFMTIELRNLTASPYASATPSGNFEDIVFDLEGTPWTFDTDLRLLIGLSGTGLIQYGPFDIVDYEALWIGDQTVLISGEDGAGQRGIFQIETNGAQSPITQTEVLADGGQCTRGTVEQSLAIEDHQVELSDPVPVGLQIEIYPNPIGTTAQVRIRSSRTEPVRLEVYDVLGRKVEDLYEQDLDAELWYQSLLDVTDYSPGVYFIRTWSRFGVRVARFMVAR